MSKDQTRSPFLTPVQQRRADASVKIISNEDKEILYQHAALCQVYLPYRDRKLEQWVHQNGKISLLVKKGELLDPVTNQFKPIDIPFGGKARLLLYHINTEALKQGSHLVEIEDSMTAFINRIHTFGGNHTHKANGRDIREYKEQMARISAADIKIGLWKEGHAITVKMPISSFVDVWWTKDEKQRVLFPSEIHLSHEYFASLQKHAIPLDELALASLSTSPQALDVYCWLAQRLHRINPKAPLELSWEGLKAQFGHGYKTLKGFKSHFKHVLKLAKLHYPAAKFELNDRTGMTLYNSPTPIQKRMVALPKK